MANQCKHIVIVGPLPPPAGGMANQTKQLASFLRSEGLEVSVIQVNPAYQPAWVGKLPMFRAAVRLWQYQATLKKALKDVDVVHVMANSGWSWHLFAAPAIRIANRYNKRVIVNYRGGYAADFFAKSWSKVKATMDLADQIVVPSPFLQQVFEQYGKESVIVPNVLNQQRFNAENRTASHQPTVIVTRNLEAIYDIATAIKVFANIYQQFPQAQLKVAGTGPELANLQQLCQQLNIEHVVSFLGRLAPDDMAALYQSADLMLNTSVVDNSPNSLIEALACGTPVVSSNVGGIPKLVTHQHDALLANAEDVDTLTEQSMAILQDGALTDKLVTNGFKTVEKFSWPSVWQQLQQCYSESSREPSYV